MNNDFNIDIAQMMLAKVRKQLAFTLSRVKESQEKTLVVVGGQPGAGKSTVTKKIEKTFGHDIVTLNGDDFKTYYPNYLDMLRKFPDGTAKVVQPYSNFVVNELKKELIAKNFNVIIEGTMRDYKVPLDSALQFSKQDYNVEAFVVATNYYASRAAYEERYEVDRIRNNGAGRSVKVEAHDETYNNIPNTIKQLISSGEFTNISICDRNANTLAELAKGDDVVKKYIEFRNKLTPELVSDIRSSFNHTLKMKLNRNAPVDEINSLSDVLKQFNKVCINLDSPKVGMKIVR